MFRTGSHEMSTAKTYDGTYHFLRSILSKASLLCAVNHINKDQAHLENVINNSRKNVFENLTHMIHEVSCDSEMLERQRAQRSYQHTQHFVFALRDGQAFLVLLSSKDAVYQSE